MSHPSTVTSEPFTLPDIVPKLGHFAPNSTFQSHTSNGYSPCLSSNLYFGSLGSQNRFKLVNSLSLNKGVSHLRQIFNDFNRAIRLHCDRIPIGFASIGTNSGESNGLSDNGGGVLEDVKVPINGVGSESPKRVLILMSDTGGGHRASAEAIRDAFNEEFGDDYQIYGLSILPGHLTNYQRATTSW